MTARIKAAMEKRDQGFTLIELLVVIIIIGILAAIAIPVFLNQRQKGVDASIKSDLKNYAVALETKTTEDPTWTQATAPAAQVSPGNVLTLSATSSAADGYCVTGENPGASDSAPFYYNSAEGGLTTTPCEAPAPVTP